VWGVPWGWVTVVGNSLEWGLEDAWEVVGSRWGVLWEWVGSVRGGADRTKHGAATNAPEMHWWVGGDSVCIVLARPGRRQTGLGTG